MFVLIQVEIMSINDFCLAGMKILAKQSWGLENDSSSGSCLLTRYMSPEAI